MTCKIKARTAKPAAELSKLKDVCIVRSDGLKVKAKEVPITGTVTDQSSMMVGHNFRGHGIDFTETLREIMNRTESGEIL